MHRVPAAVEEAALDVNHAANSPIVRRRKAKKRKPKALFQAKRAPP